MTNTNLVFLKQLQSLPKIDRPTRKSRAIVSILALTTLTNLSVDSSNKEITTTQPQRVEHVIRTILP